MVYVNLDEKFIPNAGRTGTCLSEEELLARIYTGNDDDFKYGFGIDEVQKIHPTLADDLEEVLFSVDNFSYRKGFLGHKLIGYHNVDGKLSFIGCDAGGDMECPLFFIIYWDGEKLRGYVPTCGNTFNAYLRTAFGSEGGTDVYVGILCHFVRDLGFPAIYDMFDDTDEILRRYKAKYGTATGTDSVCPNIEEESVTGPDNPNLNEDAVMRDIRAKFGIQ